MEALAEGVNYIIFEPFCTDNGNSQYELVAPFDGSEKRLLIAKTTDELCEIIKNNRLCNPQILQDFFDESYHLDQTLSELL
jgi:hypothetical protein